MMLFYNIQIIVQHIGYQGECPTGQVISNELIIEHNHIIVGSLNKMQVL